MENESDIRALSTDIEEGNPNHITDETIKEEPAPLYFSKDGRAQFGITAPTAFAVSYPRPPLPSNLSKNRVLRAIDEQRKESIQEGIIQAEKEFEKEAMPLPSLTLQGSPLPKVLISEIELAIYWDRHPYEFRVPEKGQLESQNPSNTKNINASSAQSLRRSKSEMNLASKVGKLLEEHSVTENNSSRRSSTSASYKTVRSTEAKAVSSPKNNNGAIENNVLLSPKSNSHYGEQFAFANIGNGANHTSNTNRVASASGSGNSSRKNSAKEGSHTAESESGKLHCPVRKKSPTMNAKQSLPMGENERKKFQDIKLFHHHNERQSIGQSSHSQPRLIRSQEQIVESRKKSAGVQVTIDDVAAAALKSTYLCPLHGQYKRGIERRDKGGFRTDMGSVYNVHAHCSRALKGKPSKTKMIKTAETQTEENGEASSLPFHSQNSRTSKRSKTAGHGKSPRKGKDIMASEYHGSFRNPYKIAESEKRHLRNKILNYCFTKHSIF